MPSFTAALFAATMLSTTSGAPAASTQPAPGLTVTLREVKPLKIGKEGKSRAVVGALEATITNGGQEPAPVEQLDVHGILFTNLKSSAEYVLLHPCDCAFIAWGAKPPENRIFTLAPGESRSVKLDDWSCGGSVWTPPPKGRYAVRYRVIIGKREPPKNADQGDGREMMRACEAALKSPEFWKSSVSSEPIEIGL